MESILPISSSSLENKFQNAVSSATSHYDGLVSKLPLSRNKEKFSALLKEKTSAVYYQFSDQNQKAINERFGKAIEQASHILKTQTFGSEALSTIDIDKVFKVN